MLYLDCNATTPLDPRVMQAMEPYWITQSANPSSSHRSGRAARAALEQARESVAALVHATAKQVIFTSGGTEANHLAIQGMAQSMADPGLIAFGATEHPSLHAAVDAMERQGWRSQALAVDAHGVITKASLQWVRQHRPQLISVMLANNETGVIQPLQALVAAAHEVGARVHIDATQAAGKIEIDFAALGVDCMTLSAHKLYGPKGVGALVVSPSLLLTPQLGGGGQELRRRAGTENVPAIVGFGVAAAIASSELEKVSGQLQEMRQRLEQGLEQINGVEIVAQEAERLPNTVMLLISAMEGETLLMQLDQKGVAVSSGSACQAGKSGPNPVLRAMGVDEQMGRNAIRISLCRQTTEEQIEQFLMTLRETLSPDSAVMRQAQWG